MSSFNENMMNEVAAEFQNVQDLYGDDVASHKAEMGLEAHENFLLDEFMTQEEQEVLNSELDENSPEYKQVVELFRQRLIAQAFTEVTEWTARRAADSTFDAEKALAPLVDIQERMARTMNTIQPLQKKRDVALKDLDSWVKRFNAWKNSPAYVKYPNKGKAHTAFFAGLEKRKANWYSVKAEVTEPLAQLWDSWNTDRAISNQIAPAGSELWTMYAELANTELNRYMTSGDTEQVDDFSLLANTQHEVMDVLAFSHVVEMSEENKPEANGIGFWNFREEAKCKRTAETMQAEEDYLEGLMAHIDAA